MINHTKLLITTILLTAVCFAANARNQENIERKQLFDYNWKFTLGDIQKASANDFDDKSWRSLDLPHDWSIEGKSDLKNPTSGAGGYFPAGIGWYRKEFNVPAAWRGKHVSVYFEGVYMNSEVFINGKSLGIHPYGYSSFYYDLSPYLNYNKENILAVRVDNSRQVNCRWYSGSGIYRHVWLFVTNPVHIEQWGTVITTTDRSTKKATVRIKTYVKNETSLPQSIVLSTQLTDKNAKNAGDNVIKVDVAANNEKEVVQTLIVNNPMLWTPETPYLYQVKVRVLKENQVIDATQIPFGIRTLKYSSENGFQLNGKTVKINGGCVHHDNGCLGAAAFDRAEERKVELLKSAGFNAIRTSHNPPSEAFLNACDKLGLMVIDESFDGWKESKTPYDYALFFDNWWQRDLESMLKRDRNHPSIIIWSIGNEIIERKTPEAVETAKMLVDCIHKMDSTRPVTSAMTTWDKDWEIFDPLMAAQDICGYNYQMHRAPADHERVPSRVIVQTESYPKDAFYNWNMVNTHDFIIGDFVWTAMDYLGESGIGRYYYPGEPKGEHWETDLFPWHGAYCGDIDLIGWRKPISHYRNLLWNNTEKLYMAVREPNPENGEIKETMWSVWPTWESWTWPGQEGKNIQVEVCSKYPLVRLYLNDKLIGEQPTTKEKEFKATFTLPYTPGLLKAVAVEENQEMESTVLKTADKPAQLRLMADRTKILANGQDLSFVTVEITDKNGVIQPNADNRFSFQLNGLGTIAGVDNANLKDLDPYVGTTRKAWHGRALVVIRSTRKKGDIILRVSSPELPDAIITIKSGIHL
ncbi:MAG: glycoside hydrolase family 2 TIM barrel-domain containing protein [Paludibacter sp.]|nr:glycoside hydrolase family 2 TIM barrel-domain containing protein [Paludibacter sp.]